MVIGPDDGLLGGGTLFVGHGLHQIPDGVELILDGQVGVPLKVNDRVVIKKAEYKTKFIVLNDRDYFKILRTKLKWGE